MSENFRGPMSDYSEAQLTAMMREQPDEYRFLVERETDARQKWNQTNPQPALPGYHPYQSAEAHEADMRLAVALGFSLSSFAPSDLFADMSKYRDAAIRASQLEFIDPESVAPCELRAIAPYASVNDLYRDLEIMLAAGLKPTAPSGLSFEQLHRMCAPFRRAYDASRLENSPL